MQAALARAGDRSPELEQALRHCPKQQRKGMAYLIRYMPTRDLQSLQAKFILENLALAYASRTATAWAAKIPEAVFFDAVLPYANVDETRESWRRDFRDKFTPLIASCKTPGEAAQRLNEEVFRRVAVRYSTKRRRANQSPSESIEQGLASCTGLSILLVDACRSVGVPARLAGIPAWANKRGNHTWVEVWDQGWHFTGAAEPSAEGLDHSWFAGDAALAKRDSRMNAIYAVSYRPTGLSFPLVWSPDDASVHGLNVTDRYTQARAPSAYRLMVSVVAKGERVAAQVKVTTTDGASVGRGKSKDESADTNDYLSFELPPGARYLVTATLAGRKVRATVEGRGTQSIVKLNLSTVDDSEPPSSKQMKKLRQALSAWWKAGPKERKTASFSPSQEDLLLKHPEEVRALVWDVYSADVQHQGLRDDCKKNQVRFGDHLSPFTCKQVGTKPKAGWPLVIAMHGGGGAPQRVNDSQWRIMQRYYRDHPEVSGYLYLALRAPNNSWNGFYDDYVYPLIANLIRQQVLCAGVDSDKVNLIGYSHGGYGAFAIGPKMPDHFAAIHASAAAPTDGQTSTKTLRTTPFTFMIGERDSAYGRLERCKKFDLAVRALRGDRKDIYPVVMEYQKGFGHGGLPDRDKLKDLLLHRRNGRPSEISWQQTDTVIRDFFWLEDDAPNAGAELQARFEDNTFVIDNSEAGAFAICGDAPWIQFGKPLTLIIDGQKSVITPKPSLRTLCEAMQRRGDRQLAYSWRHIVAR